jgi:hypothetical protein
MKSEYNCDSLRVLCTKLGHTAYKKRTAPHTRESSDKLKHDCNFILPDTLEEMLQRLSNCSNILCVSNTIQPNSIMTLNNNILNA